MMLLSKFWRTGDSPWLRRTSCEISWKITGFVRTVKLIKIALYVLFIWVNYLISSPFMMFSFQQVWDLSSSMEVPLVFTHLQLPQKDPSETGGSRETEAQKATEKVWQQRMQHNQLMSFQHGHFEDTFNLKPTFFFFLTLWIYSFFFFVVSWGSPLEKISEIP